MVSLNGRDSLASSVPVRRPKTRWTSQNHVSLHRLAKSNDLAFRAALQYQSTRRLLMEQEEATCPNHQVPGSIFAQTIPRSGRRSLVSLRPATTLVRWTTRLAG